MDTFDNLVLFMEGTKESLDTERKAAQLQMERDIAHAAISYERVAVLEAATALREAHQHFKLVRAEVMKALDKLEAEANGDGSPEGQKL